LGLFYINEDLEAIILSVFAMS